MTQNVNVTLVNSATYTIVESDTVIMVNFAGLVSIILPTGAAGRDERSYYIKDISGNATLNPITVSASGSRKIDGVTFALLNVGYSHIHVVSDGSNWFTI